jgi:hypothetical protein
MKPIRNILARIFNLQSPIPPGQSRDIASAASDARSQEAQYRVQVAMIAQKNNGANPTNQSVVAQFAIRQALTSEKSCDKLKLVRHLP